MLNDLRYAVRMLLKNPGFSFIAILTPALGICGVTTQFSVIDAALIRGLPFPEADRLVRVVVLAAAMSLACIVPARRAARIDPMVALRSE